MKKATLTGVAFSFAFTFLIFSVIHFMLSFPNNERINMNSVFEFLNSHASVRKFTEREISLEDEIKIVRTAQRSPTSSNIQAYSIISVRNQKSKDKLAELCGNQHHVRTSSLFLVFCADLYRLKRINEQKGYEFHGDNTESFIVSTVDAALAACRALTAAQALGMGGVMVGGIRNNPEEVGKLLELPELVYPLMGMSLGYPESPPKIKPRLDVQAVWHKEKYSDMDFDVLIDEYDKVLDQIGYLKGREVDSEKYPDFEGLYSWSEHTARRMAKNLRPHMKNYLLSKGFMQE